MEHTDGGADHFDPSFSPALVKPFLYCISNIRMIHTRGDLSITLFTNALCNSFGLLLLCECLIGIRGANTHRLLIAVYDTALITVVL